MSSKSRVLAGTTFACGGISPRPRRSSDGSMRFPGKGT